MLLEGWLFALVVRESRYFSWLGPTIEDGHIVLLEGRLFGFVARESRFFSWSCLPRSCEYCIAGLCVVAP